MTNNPKNLLTTKNQLAMKEPHKEENQDFATSLFFISWTMWMCQGKHVTLLRALMSRSCLRVTYRLNRRLVSNLPLNHLLRTRAVVTMSTNRSSSTWGRYLMRRASPETATKATLDTTWALIVNNKCTSSSSKETSKTTAATQLAGWRAVLIFVNW